MCACECVYVWGKRLLAFFPSSGLSATTVQITQVFVVASAVLLTAKNRSSLHPTSKYFLQYQAMVLTQLPLTDYWCVSSLRIWGRDKQWGYDHVCFQTGVFSFYSRVSMSGKYFFFFQEMASAMWGSGCLQLSWYSELSLCTGFVQLQENSIEIFFQNLQWKQQICRFLKGNESMLSSEVIKMIDAKKPYEATNDMNCKLLLHSCV